MDPIVTPGVTNQLSEAVIGGVALPDTVREDIVSSCDER